MKTLLNRMRVWQKLLLLGGLGVLLTVTPLTLYLHATYADWAFTRQEAGGIEPSRLVLKVIQLTQQHRGLSAQVAGGNTASVARRETKGGEVEQAIADFESKSKETLENEKVAKAWTIAVGSWRALEKNVTTGSISVADSFAEHTAVISQQFGTLEQIRDTSNLSLDPDTDGYFLHLASLIELPNTTEQLGQLGATGAGVLAKGASRAASVIEPGAIRANESERSAVIAVADRVRVAQQSAFRAIEKASEYWPSLSNKVSAVAAEANSKITKVIALAEHEIVRADTLSLSSTEYVAQMTDANNALFKVNDVAINELKNVLDQRSSGIAQRAAWLSAIVPLLALMATVLSVLIARSITSPVQRLSETVRKFAEGDDLVRTELQSQDEFGELGRAFDKMMDDRVASAAAIKKENETLNDSVLSLLQGVAKLSRKDLTARVIVAADVTGPVADALNLLSRETAAVMQKVTDISADVSNASVLVKQQSDTVQTAANTEREQGDATAKSLEAASQAMAQIAELAQVCNVAGERATATTQRALSTVDGTVGGINSTRDTIRETEKRIKRLGERSQEISVAVGLINTIAERTHILALNAAMHAASAGEAGRGFAVVADEVQRLAESARQATQQIAALVGNIQVETADTVNTMNSAIAQVVEGSKLAEEAGQQMRVTQDTTAELVASVQHIAVQSKEQVVIANQLIERTAQSKESSLKTNAELVAQGEQTSRLVEYAKSLLSAVRVFKLSES